MSLRGNYKELLKSVHLELDNVEKVNSLYQSWRDSGKSEQLEGVTVWCYCWIRRYFVHKYVQKKIVSVANVEILIEEAFFSFYRKHSTLRNPLALSHWVAIASKYCFYNYIRSAYSFEFMPDGYDEAGSVDFESDLHNSMEAKYFMDAILSLEVGALPDHIRLIIQKKIWDGKSYEEIAQETGYSVETARAYYSRGINALRNSKKLLSMADEWQIQPFSR